MKRSFKTAAVENTPDHGRSRTAEAILHGAIRVLKRDGFAGLSARSIAAEAGTNLALLNYHFGTKENLLLAIFEELDAGRLERQRRMYEDPRESLSQKWRRAIAFYRQDLADGYVRILQELTAYGYTNELIGTRVRRRMRGWRSLLEETIRREAPRAGLTIDPALVASGVASFWYGMEEQQLTGVSEREGRFFELLESVAEWLERRERALGKARSPRRRLATSGRTT